MSYSNKSPKVIISENILYRERKHKCFVCQITLGRNYSFYFQFDFFQDFSLLFLKKKKKVTATPTTARKLLLIFPNKFIEIQFTH